MKIIISYEPAIDPAAIRAQAEADLIKAQDGLAHAEIRLAEVLDELGYTGKDRDDFVSGRMSNGSGRGNSERAEVATMRSKVISAQDALRRAREIQPQPARIVIDCLDSYAHKDILKGRGYRFLRDGFWADFLGMRTLSTWRLMLPADNPEKLGEEMQALRPLGTVELRAGLDQAVRSALTANYGIVLP